MEIKHKNSPKKTLPLIVGLAIIFLVIVIYSTLHKSNSGDAPRINNETSDSNKKKDLIDSTNPDGTLKKDPGGQDETNNYNPPVTESSIQLETSQSGNTVVVKSTLDNISSGSCMLTAKNGDAEINKVADILYQPQYSTCMGFSIPVESLGTGKWRIIVTVEANGSTAIKETTFEVK